MVEVWSKKPAEERAAEDALLKQRVHRALEERLRMPAKAADSTDGGGGAAEREGDAELAAARPSRLAHLSVAEGLVDKGPGAASHLLHAQISVQK